MDLAGAEQARYARQLALPGFSEAGQPLVRNARVHLVGAGLLGGPALLVLAQAGVGTLHVDDGENVQAEDRTAWLYPADRAGEPRAFAAIAAVREASSLVQVRSHATGLRPTATLVCALNHGQASAAAERARLAGLPHVVVLLDGDGGSIVAVPSGAPCLRCARPRTTNAPSAPGAPGALGVLGALELVLLLAGAATHSGRLIELRRGLLEVRATTRSAGCDCVNVY